MRRLVAAILAALPFDPRSRRALDETLADWAHEEASAGSAMRRATTGARALVAATRAVVISTVGEVGRVPYGWLATRVALLTALPVAFGLLEVSFRTIREFGARGVIPVALLVPSEALVWMPPVLFLALGWRPGSRSAPAVGTAVVIMAMIVTLGGWIVPMANQYFREVVWRSLSAGSSVAGPAPGLAELSLVDLLKLATSGGQDSLSAWAGVLRISGLAALSATAALLGVATTRRSAIRSLAWLVAAPVTYVADPLLARVALASLGLSMGLAPGLAFWCLTAIVVVALIVLSRTGRRVVPGVASDI